ncbi:anti-sigma regulatory factor [Geitlerinema sp. PCC 9228]|uniref:ATP-binding protein n=1 Tax=Geitlerinema sp. PCC 9228 TaxID=111611 RepID=UPI0008F9867C|nr:anti-sigma regulatory factor [Geitlerinema sp. PCC 9228]
MITISRSPGERKGTTISFPSTLYLYPILDILLADIPKVCQNEVRLGLQEALVNAAKHGNQLDPSKAVIVHFSVRKDIYRWVICDQGNGFGNPCSCQEASAYLPEDTSHCGRGLFIIYQIFDRVHWSSEGRKLVLCKNLKNPVRIPFFSSNQALVASGR